MCRHLLFQENYDLKSVGKLPINYSIIQYTYSEKLRLISLVLQTSVQEQIVFLRTVQKILQ
jgi:hypothetical protein